MSDEWVQRYPQGQCTDAASGLKKPENACKGATPFCPTNFNTTYYKMKKIEYALNETEAAELKQMYITLVAMHNKIQAMQQRNERNLCLVMDLSEDEYNAHYDEALNLETNGGYLAGLEDTIKDTYQTIEDMYADVTTNKRII